MHHHHETKQLPYSPRQIFDLVADVQKYPEFLPWCTAARIIRREGDEFLGELVINYKAFTERYTSRVVLTPTAAIDVYLVQGPFEHLVNHWKFFPEGENGTRIDFNISFKFRSKIIDKLIGSFFQKATEKMVGAFCERADALYGRPGAEAAKPAD